MKICGFQKLTLLDYPQKTACTVFTYGCNFRCPFCHNAMLVTQNAKEEIPINEILSHLEKRKGILDGVCISGGEPLLQEDIGEFAEKIKDMGFSVKIDTNGSNFEKLKILVDSNLVDYVAMDIKSSPENYLKAIGLGMVDFESIEKSKSFIMNCGVDYEFRTTAVNGLHTVEDFEKIGLFIKGAKRYFIQKFVDSGNLIKSGFSELDEETMQECLNSVRKYVPSAMLRGV